jgi:hypothetical protein
MMGGMEGLPEGLRIKTTAGGQAFRVADRTWRLAIPPGPAGRYRLAQLDDYEHLPRRDFRWKPGVEMRLEARASSASIPGTWGFGLWNDPFSMGLLTQGGLLRLMALPDTAWFFFASPPSYLSLRDDLPAQGGLAACFASPAWPPVLLTPAILAAPLLLLPPAVRLARRLTRRVVLESAAGLDLDPTEWHEYRLSWEARAARFSVDGQEALSSQIAPRGPLGLVIWVDNQYMALPPSGRLGYGMLPNSDPAWIEVREMRMLKCGQAVG